MFAVYLGSTWGGPPTADLLQNIVSSVIRQGLVPGVEGVTLQMPQNQTQGQTLNNQSGPDEAPHGNQSRPGQPGQGGQGQRRKLLACCMYVFVNVDIIYGFNARIIRIKKKVVM